MIDFHVHIGNLYRHSYPNNIGLSVHQLIERMNREGIEMSVLLPLESPEGAFGYFLTEQAIEARDKCTAGHTDRVYRVAKITAGKLGWPGKKMVDLRTGCILHELAK